jgi:hypothetical protein
MNASLCVDRAEVGLHAHLHALTQLCGGPADGRTLANPNFLVGDAIFGGS